jgi:antirestriction protein
VRNAPRPATQHLGGRQSDQPVWYTWWDATGTPERLKERIGSGHIYDSSDFGGFVVWQGEDPAVIAAVANGIAEYGLAFAAWAQLHDANPGMLDAFSDHYLGEYSSCGAFGRSLVDVSGWSETQLPDAIQPWVYVDYAGLARQALDDSDLVVLYATEKPALYIFRGPQ